MKTKWLLPSLILTAAGMFGFAYALVPLYDVFCEVTGLNGKTGSRMRADNTGTLDPTRTITVTFITQLNQNMPWEFYPEQTSLIVHPGETKKIVFYAKNLTAQDMIGQAIPSVSPGLAAQHLKKTECFCFNNQPLAAGHDAPLPLVFFIDNDIPADIQEVTLSYTLFDITPEGTVKETGET